MNRTFSTLLAGFALFACSGCEAKAPPPKPVKQSVARPALWKVYDADTTVYLFGTIHLLPQGMTWTGPKLDAAMAQSQDLVLETVIDDPAALGAIMMKLGRSPGLPPILDRVPPAIRPKLKATIDKTGIPIATLDGMETWAASLVISTASLRAADLTSDEGAEAQLTAAFRKAGKPVNGLETPAQQLGYFDGLSEAAQRQFLVSVSDGSANIAKEFGAMIASWRRGDVKNIAQTFNNEMKDSAELADTLLTKRNQRWAAWIVQRMAKPGTVFVAVGAGHLAGKDSVEALLTAQGKAKGVKVVRVQ
ncbi:MAG: TraB/GumN family protein [Sphingomonadales bacterium]